MSQPERVKKERKAPPKSKLPAVLSALIVVAIFIALGAMLASPLLPAPTNTTTTAATSTDTTAIIAAGPTDTTGTAVSVPGEPKLYNALPPMTIDPKKPYTATITTPRGDIVIKLRPDLAPQTVNSFVFLSKEGFYNGLTWHRVLPNFMAQGGDPKGDGTGGPGYTVPDEFTDKVLFDRPGIVAMAKTNQPNSGGSQFFITTAPYPSLNKKYTIFGEVMSGLDIVNGIPLRDPDQGPTTPGEQIVKITISEG